MWSVKILPKVKFSNKARTLEHPFYEFCISEVTKSKILCLPCADPSHLALQEDAGIGYPYSDELSSYINLSRAKVEGTLDTGHSRNLLKYYLI